MKKLLLVCGAVLSLALLSFTSYDGDPVKKLRNGNYAIPADNEISSSDARALKDMTVQGAFAISTKAFVRAVKTKAIVFKEDFKAAKASAEQKRKIQRARKILDKYTEKR